MNAQVARKPMLVGGIEKQQRQPEQDSSESEFELDLGPADKEAAASKAAMTARPKETKRMREEEDSETESEQEDTPASDHEQAQLQQHSEEQPSKLARAAAAAAAAAAAEETAGSGDNAKGGAESGGGGGSGSGKGQRLNAYLVESAFKLPLDFIRSHHRKPRPNEMRDLRTKAFEEALVKDPGGLKGRHRVEPPDAKSVHMKRQSIMLAYTKLQRYQAEGKRPTDTRRLSERDQHISRCASYIMEYKKLRARVSAKKRKDTSFGNGSSSFMEQDEGVSGYAIHQPQCSTLGEDQTVANERMTQLLLHIQQQQELREKRLCLLTEEQQRLMSEALESQTRQQQHMTEFDVKFKQLREEKAMKLKR